MSSTLIPQAPGGAEQQDAPLTPDERKLLVRLLSDPTYFPIEFRTWVRNYVETSGIQLPRSAITGGISKLNLPLPAGIILPYAGTTFAKNVIPCDGRSLLREDYDELFQAIGTSWGVVDATHFSVPDLRDRALYGVGSQIGLGQTDGKAIGARGGGRHHHLQQGATGAGGKHSHSMSGEGGHDHDFNGSGGGETSYGGGHTHAPSNYNFPEQGSSQTGASGQARYTTQNPVYSTGYGGDHSHSVNVNVNGSTSWDGDHDHTIYEQADHTHTLSGATSGGGDQDRPSFAGVHYVISTGQGF